MNFIIIFHKIHNFHCTCPEFSCTWGILQALLQTSKSIKKPKQTHMHSYAMFSAPGGQFCVQDQLSLKISIQSALGLCSPFHRMQKLQI